MMLQGSVEQLRYVQIFSDKDVTPCILLSGKTACIARILPSDWYNKYKGGVMMNYWSRKDMSTEQIYVAIKPFLI
jgi:hypothetical protein